MSTTGVDDTELRLARLTLLALRGNVPDDVPFRPGLVRLPPVMTPIADRQAALSLALRTKPLQCYAEVEDGLFTVVARRFPFARQPDPDEDPDASWWRAVSGGDVGRAILCLGRPGEWLCLTIDEFHAWQREYQNPSGGYVADRGSRAGEIPDDARRDAETRGAVAFLHFWAPRTSDRSTGTFHIERLQPIGVSGAETEACGRCGTRPAQYEVRWYDEARPPRALCQHCIDVEYAVDQFDAARSLGRWAEELAEMERRTGPEELSEQAHFLAVWWAFRSKPPFVREFVAKHRRY